MNCSEFKRNLYHFQAGELAGDLDRGVRAHAEGCPDCGRRLTFEEAFLGRLKSGLRSEVAPPGLETRIRERLREESGPAGRSSVFGWLRAPAFLVGSAALVLVVLFGLTGVGASVVNVTDQEVLVVDRDCDEMGKDLEVQRRCAAVRHINALKLPDGEYWTIHIDGGEYRDLVLDPSHRGQRLMVRGEFYPRIGTIDLTSTREIGTTTVSARLD